MAWLIIFSALGGMFGFLFYKKMGYAEGLWFNVLFFCLVGLFGGFLAAMHTVALSEKEWVLVETTGLVSMRDHESIHGSFFLGSGSIGTTQYYFYYEKAGDGFRPGKLRVSDEVTIFEWPKESGELRFYELRLVDQSSWWTIFKGSARDERTEFSIPEGSLKKDFVLR